MQFGISSSSAEYTVYEHMQVFT